VLEQFLLSPIEVIFSGPEEGERLQKATKDAETAYN